MPHFVQDVTRRVGQHGNVTSLSDGNGIRVAMNVRLDKQRGDHSHQPPPVAPYRDLSREAWC
jgi:hypothetical protein